MTSSDVEGLSVPIDDDYETLISTSDVELLKRAWRNEKAAPQILSFQTHLISRIREQIQLMEDTVEEKSSSGIDPLSISLYQMDLDRAQFLLRSYLRIRIQKIEKFVLNIAKTDELWSKLSREEKDFARRCTEDIKQHLEDSVLSKLPENYQSFQKQSVVSEEDDMIPEPQLDTFVVCRSKEYLTGIQLEDGPVDDRSMLFEMEPGVLYFICYKSIKALVESGKIDLL